MEEQHPQRSLPWPHALHSLRCSTVLSHSTSPIPSWILFPYRSLTGLQPPRADDELTRAAAGLCHSAVRRARSLAPSRADWTCPPEAVLRACLQAWSSAGTGELGLERVASELRGPDCLCKQCDLCQTPAFILEVCTLDSRRQSVPVWGAPSKNAGAESLVSLPSQQFCTRVVTAIAGGDQTSPEWFSAGGLLPDAPVFTLSTVPLAGSALHPLLP